MRKILCYIHIFNMSGDKSTPRCYPYIKFRFVASWQIAAHRGTSLSLARRLSGSSSSLTSPICNTSPQKKRARSCA